MKDGLKSVPCTACNTQYPPYIMQFHHPDPSKKHKNISAITSIKALMREIEKCVILCANCHEITELEKRLAQAINGKIRKRSNIVYRRGEAIRKIADLARGVPCLDCGNSFPCSIMHFHHRNREEKSFEIMQSIRLKWITEDTLLSEIKKCVVLCPNCHLEREWGVNGILRKHFHRKFHGESPN